LLAGLVFLSIVQFGIFIDFFTNPKVEKSCNNPLVKLICDKPHLAIEVGFYEFNLGHDYAMVSLTSASGLTDAIAIR